VSKLLIIDDHEVVRAGVKRILTLPVSCSIAETLAASSPWQYRAVDSKRCLLIVPDALRRPVFGTAELIT
jgi:DNA-binding NarL/FixJ family response regulator